MKCRPTRRTLISAIATYRGDLTVTRVAPDGSTYALKASSSGDSADNVNTTYTANLSSEAADGTWQLRVQDVCSAAPPGIHR